MILPIPQPEAADVTPTQLHKIADRPEQGRGPERRAVSLTQHRLADLAAVIAGLPADTWPLTSVAAYDQLLRLPERKTPEAAPTVTKGTDS